MNPDPGQAVHGLDPRQLAPGERPLASWRHVRHWVVLTNRRLLGLTGIDLLPEHRTIDWEIDLAGVKDVHVLQMAGTTTGRDAARYGVGTSAAPTARVSFAPLAPSNTTDTEGGYELLVDGTVVFKGHPRRCSELQDAIEGARFARSG